MCLDSMHLSVEAPLASDTFAEWWLRARATFHGKERRGFDTFVIETVWSLWKQRNARVFRRPEQVKGPRELASWILDELQELIRAGVGVGGLDRFVRS